MLEIEEYAPMLLEIYIETIRKKSYDAENCYIIGKCITVLCALQFFRVNLGRGS